MQDVQTVAQRIVDNVEEVIVGKHEAVQLTVIALLCQGHLLIEDVPGTGKTMLAKSVAKSLGCIFRRIQFTPDMLPGDITGVAVYNQKTQDFEFRPGPIITQIVLADEINRATPKVQSALLECMDEGQITVDGITHQIPSPFHVLATQNPIEYEGTFPLPETQLDRFMMCVSLGYPSMSDEIDIMERQQYMHPVEQLVPVAGAPDILMLQEAVKSVYVDDLVKQVSGFVASLKQGFVCEHLSIKRFLTDTSLTDEAHDLFVDLDFLGLSGSSPRAADAPKDTAHGKASGNVG